ncbi:MAG: radical SAM protein, partial [Pseudonocardia sp.]
LWLQLTGGEPLIDPLFAETLAYAHGLGMMIQISSNGSRLHQQKTLDLLRTYRPYRLTLSMYGATEKSYDGMTRSRGAFKRFMRGLEMAHEAGLKMRINCVLSKHNTHERDEMKSIADRYGIPSFEYTNITPTIHGTGEVLPSTAAALSDLGPGGREVTRLIMSAAAPRASGCETRRSRGGCGCHRRGRACGSDPGRAARPVAVVFPQGGAV